MVLPSSQQVLSKCLKTDLTQLPGATPFDVALKGLAHYLCALIS